MPFPPEIWALIIRESSLDSLAMLAMLSSTMRILVLDDIQKDFRLRISSWFPEYDCLFDTMRMCAANIYGSWAVWFATRAVDWEPYSLGFALPSSKDGRDFFRQFLADSGYVREDVPRNPATLSQMFGAVQVRWHFVHPQTGRRVHFQRSASKSPIAISAHSPSTLGFLYITPDVFFCAYPQLLSIRTALLSPSAHRAQAIDFLFSKWLPRRYIFTSKHHLVLQRPISVVGRRFLETDNRSHDDGGCLWIPMTKGVVKKATGPWMVGAMKCIEDKIVRWNWAVVKGNRPVSISLEIRR